MYELPLIDRNKLPQVSVCTFQRILRLKVSSIVKWLSHRPKVRLVNEFGVTTLLNMKVALAIGS